jgi:transcriptional regulator with XRE-family HTH domain
MKGLRTARRTKDITQQQLADMMEVNVQTVRNWESGKINIYSSRLLKLSEILEVSCDYILKGEEVNV